MALSQIQKELCLELKKIIIDDEDTYIGTMLMLIVKQNDPDGNCKELLDFIRNTPNVSYDEVMDKADEIVGII